MTELGKETGAHTEEQVSYTGGVTQGGPPAGFGKNVNDYLNHYVTVADAKAAAVLAADFAILYFLLKEPCAKSLEVILFGISLSLLAFSCLMALLVLLPRLPGGSNGVIFWEDIRKNASPEAYEKKVSPLDRVALEREYVHQNYHTSSVLHRKMRWMQWSISSFAVGALITLIIAIW